ncbi:MAG: hypothetical protein COA42_07105 [Alteromonadaceae bacterium]|nr:MAG: hypothetical protein COA42_07105 [Alteromonadaceae bacterium]
MLQCKQCGEVYEDNSSYCNACNITLSEQGTAYVMDNQALKQQSIDDRKTTLLFKNTLIVVLLLFPFTAFLGGISFIYKTGEKAIITIIIEALCIAAFYFLKKDAELARKIIFALAFLLTILFPMASVAGIFLLALLFKK